MRKKITQKKAKARGKTQKNEKKRSFKYTRLQAKLDNRKKSTAYGGLGLVHSLLTPLRLADEIDDNLHLLKQSHGYTESDHIIAQAYNIYSGGECLEDMNNFRNNKGIKNLLQTELIPSPSAGGDFLRRFTEDDIWLLQDIKLKKAQRIWEMNGSKKKEVTADTDSTIKKLYGECQEGADISHNGQWSYHPELVTLSELDEIIAVENRPGSAKSGAGVAKILERVYPYLTSSFKKVRHRGDTKYSTQKIIKKDEEYDVEFFLGYNCCKTLNNAAEAIDDNDWVEILNEETDSIPNTQPKKRRKKKRRYRDEVVLRRGYKKKETFSRSVAEIRYKPTWSDKDYRMVIVRHNIATTKGGYFLFDLYEYYFIITNNETWDKEKIVSFHYGRGDQENIIKEWKNDFAGLRMPTGDLLSNWAWMVIASLAWSFKSWICQIGFEDGLKWMWKRFRHGFVYVNTCFHKGSRQIIMIIDGSHRFANRMLSLLKIMEQLEFT